MPTSNVIDPGSAGREFFHRVHDRLSTDSIAYEYLDNGILVLVMNPGGMRESKNIKAWAKELGFDSYRLDPVRGLSRKQARELLADLEAAGTSLADGVVAYGLTLDGSWNLQLRVDSLPGKSRGVQTKVERGKSAFKKRHPDLPAGTVDTAVIVGEASAMPQADPRAGGTADGADWIKADSTQGNCTLGFLTLRPGGKGGITAGHCLGAGNVYSPGQGHTVTFSDLSQATLGQISPAAGQNSYSAAGGPDIASFWIMDAPVASVPTVYVSSTGYKAVQGTTLDQDQVWGLQLCWSGWGLVKNEGIGKRCGALTYFDYTLNYSDGVAKHLNCIKGKNYGGDSGGPTYWVWPNGRAEATGITSGIYYYWLLGWNYYSCYQPISQAIAASGMNIWSL